MRRSARSRRLLAAVAYVDRDDLDVAIGDALNDGRVSYTLGFYRPDENRNAAVHRIEVRTSCEVILRYRTSYSGRRRGRRGQASRCSPRGSDRSTGERHCDRDDCLGDAEREFAESGSHVRCFGAGPGTDERGFGKARRS